MRNYSKAIALVLALVIAAMLIGCNQSAQQQQGKKKVMIGISMSTLSFPWQKFLTNTSVNEIEKRGGTAIVLDAQGRVDKQNADIEDLIIKKVDVILLNAIDGKAVVPAIIQANNAKIPVITTARRVEGGGEVTQHISADNVAGGKKIAEYAAEKIGGKGEVAMIEGTPGSSSTTDRTAGFKQGISKFPNIKLVYDRPGNYDRSTALTLTEDLLQAHPNVASIYYQDDDMAIGGVRAIKAAGKLDKILVVSNDGIQEVFPLIKNGEVGATIYNDAITEGKMSVASAYKVISGEKVDSLVSPPNPVIDKTNVDQFVKIFEEFAKK
jgi:ribose transport system substrate-binding protein